MKKPFTEKSNMTAYITPGINNNIPAELSGLLAKAIFRKQKRQANQHVEETCQKPEKPLDDVAHQAIVVSERDSNYGERRR